MKSFIFNIIALLVISIACRASDIKTIVYRDSIDVNDSLMYLSNSHIGGENIVVDTTISSYDRRIHRYRKHWATLIPTQHIIQYAGNMGFLSLGIGWNYGRHEQWETHLLFGYLPKYGSNRNKITMTIKETYIPWSIYSKGGWLFEPLTCGLYVNSVFGHEFWNKQPARYNDGYYPFLSTKYRWNIFFGQQVAKIVPYNKRKLIKRITAFYEVSTCDLYIRAIVQDDYVQLWDILSLSLGLKFQLF